MATRELTPGALQRREWSQPWSARVPRELLVLGRVYIYAMRLLLDGTGPTHDPTVDWEGLYRRPEGAAWRRVLSLLTPALASANAPPPVSHAALDQWLRGLIRGIAPLMNRGKSVTPAAIEEATKYIERELPRLRVELRASLDHVAALGLFRSPLAPLVQRAQRGDLHALETLLRINPALEGRPWVRDVAAKAVKTDGLLAPESLNTAISQGLDVRQSKLLKIGALLVLLWPWLGRLTTSQRRGFLKALHLPDVPGKEALREYGRRLGVKALYDDEGGKPHDSAPV